MATNKEIEQKLAKKVKYAKHTNINFMTIQQIQDAKKILNAKLSDRNLDGTIRIKLESLSADYEQAERSIDKYYKAVTDNPKTRSLRYGQRNLLTIAQIKNKQGFKKNKDIKYNAVDWMRDVKMDKIALGVGVAAMGVGSYMAIASIKVGEKTLGEIIKQALGQWIKSNPWAFGLLAGGASLIALSKIVPAIDKKHQDIVRHKKDVNAMQNSISEALSADEFQVDSKMLSNADFANSKDFDNFAHALNDNPKLRDKYIAAINHYNDPENDKDYTGMTLTGTQIKNVLKALKHSVALQKDSNKLNKEYVDAVKEYNSSLPEETTQQTTTENTTEETKKDTTEETKTDETVTQNKTEETKTVPTANANVIALENQLDDLTSKAVYGQGGIKSFTLFQDSLKKAVEEGKISQEEAVRLRVLAEMRKEDLRNAKTSKTPTKGLEDEKKL